MKKIIFYDVETSGLPLWREPSNDPRQPHLVQVAALLVDLESHKIIDTLDEIVRPDGWTIPDEVVAVHGITTERAMDVGSSEQTILETLLGMHSDVTFRVAHNESFDARMVRIACKRFLGEEVADAWKGAPAECTARMTRPLVALPRNKMPTLGEAYQHLFGTELQGAHSAMVDARACMQVFLALQQVADQQAA